MSLNREPLKQAMKTNRPPLFTLRRLDLERPLCLLDSVEVMPFAGLGMRSTRHGGRNSR